MIAGGRLSTRVHTEAELEALYRTLVEELAANLAIDAPAGPLL